MKGRWGAQTDSSDRPGDLPVVGVRQSGGTGAA